NELLLLLLLFLLHGHLDALDEVIGLLVRDQLLGVGPRLLLLRIRVGRQLLVGVVKHTPDDLQPDLLRSAGARLGPSLARVLRRHFLWLWRRFFVLVAAFGLVVAAFGFFFLVAFTFFVFVFVFVGAFLFFFLALFTLVVLAAHVHAVHRAFSRHRRSLFASV